jgi:signal transduction histidine kinase
MRRPGLRIRHKIGLPFTLLLVGGIAVTAYISVGLVSRALESHFEERLADVSAWASLSDFANNPTILSNLKSIVGADIVTFDREGLVRAGTLPPETEHEWLGLILDPATVAGLFDRTETFVSRRVSFRGLPYMLALRPVRNAPDTCVAVLREMSDIVEAQRSVTKPIILLSVGMMLLISLLSQIVTRTITSPIQRLVEGTRRLAAGEWDAVVEPPSDDEVGELTRAFNEMAGELRRTEERLLHSEKLAVTGQLAARVAHDIRNPLSSIKMRVQLARNRLDPGDPGFTSLVAVLDDVERVEWVVQGLLDLARPVELDLAPTDLNEDVIAAVLQSTAAYLHHAKITVEKHLDAELPPMLLDADHLKLAFVNVVQNAAEAMPGGGRLVASTRSENRGSVAVVEIHDNGTGLDPGSRERLFDPFFTTKREGVGLGLVNARSIIRGHGGSIELRPATPEGTRAIITLPVRSPDSETPVSGESGTEGPLG